MWPYTTPVAYRLVVPNTPSNVLVGSNPALAVTKIPLRLVGVPAATRVCGAIGCVFSHTLQGAHAAGAGRVARPNRCSYDERHAAASGRWPRSEQWRRTTLPTRMSVTGHRRPPNLANGMCKLPTLNAMLAIHCRQQGAANCVTAVDVESGSHV